MDILPGSAIHEVYEVTKEEYAALQKEIKALEEERLHALVGDGEGITIFNTTGHDRSDIVELGEIHAEAVKGCRGRDLSGTEDCRRCSGLCRASAVKRI